MHLVILVSHLRQSKFMPCKPHQVLTMHPNAHQMCANTPTSARPILIILFSIFKLQFCCPMLSHGAPWCPPVRGCPVVAHHRACHGVACAASVVSPGDPHPAGAACSLKADLGYRLDTLQLGYRQSVVCDNQWCVTISGVASIGFISVELHCYMAAPCKPHTLCVEAAIRYSSALVRSNWNDPWRQWSCWQLAKKIHVSSFPRVFFPKSYPIIWSSTWRSDAGAEPAAPVVKVGGAGAYPTRSTWGWGTEFTLMVKPSLLFLQLLYSYVFIHHVAALISTVG